MMMKILMNLEITLLTYCKLVKKYIIILKVDQDHPMKLW